jgi:putative flippase GtrA
MDNLFNKIINNGLIKRLSKFILAGGIAAVVNFSSRIIFSLFFHFAVAVVFAYTVGMITAFILCKVFVFEPSGQSTARQFYYFTLVNIAAIIQTVTISVILAKWIFPKVGMNYHSEEIAHFIGIVVPIFSSYIGHKKFSFKKTD